MRLYHGTDIKFRQPKLEKCNPYTDFGRGFYLTHELERAKEWGKSRSPRICFVNVYEITDNYINDLRLQGFNILQFQETTAEWAERDGLNVCIWWRQYDESLLVNVKKECINELLW